MTEIRDLLDQIDRLDQQTTKGPWVMQQGVDTPSGWYDGHVYSCHDGEYVTDEVSDSTGEFIALARTALPKLAEAVYQVLALLDAEENRPSRITAIDGLQRPARVQTSEVRQAINDALGADDD